MTDALPVTIHLDATMHETLLRASAEMGLTLEAYIARALQLLAQEHREIEDLTDDLER